MGWLFVTGLVVGDDVVFVGELILVVFAVNVTLDDVSTAFSSFAVFLKRELFKKIQKTWTYWK